MGNLHELHIPPDADESTDWAVRREFGLRYDAYREAMAWGVVTLAQYQRRFECDNPEAQWYVDMEEQFSMKVKP
jgi:hypothetical protein